MSMCIRPSRPTKVVTESTLEHPGVMVAVTVSPTLETNSNWVPCQVTGMPLKLTIPAVKADENPANGSPKAACRTAGEVTPAEYKSAYGSMIFRLRGLIRSELP